MMVLCCFFLGVIVVVCILFFTFDLLEDNEATDQDADSGASDVPRQAARPSSGSRPVVTTPLTAATSMTSQSQSITKLPVTFATSTSRTTTPKSRTTAIATTSKSTTAKATRKSTTATSRKSTTITTTRKITTTTTTRKSTTTTRKITTTTTTRKSTTTTTRKSTTTTTPKSTPSTPSTTKYMPTKPPGDLRPLPFYPLICTMDCIKTIYSIEDGLCDFIFFESLYRICGGEIGEPQLSLALRRFVMLAKGANKTQYAVSIDASKIQDFTKHLKIPDALAWVDTQLWKNNIYHWGIMTIHQFHLRANPDVLKDALAALNAVALFSQKSPMKTVASYTFIGFFEVNQSCDTIGKYATSFFTPNAMVVLGHIAFDENKVRGFSLPCFVVPPNCIEPPAAYVSSRQYSHTVEDAALQVSCLRQKYNISVPICVSFTLQGRWYEPSNFIDDKSSKGKYVYKQCDVKNFTQEDDPLELCYRPGVAYHTNVDYDQKARSVVYFDDNPSARRTFIFDNSFSLRYKVCVMKRQSVNVSYSLAAYDVNFDSGPSSCDHSLLQGKYARTKQLKKLADFIAHNYTSAQDLNACRNVT